MTDLHNEKFNNTTLQDLLERKTFTLDETFQIIKNICISMNEYMQKGLVHRNISANHILIIEDTMAIEMTDFSSSISWSNGRKDNKNKDYIGIPEYMAPEMSGRMNRDVDYRSDIYSLGVLFYQLLTGELPYQSKDILEILHMHIAKELPKHKKFYEYPEQVFQLINKLMAKDKEDRYQSMSGLIYDLEIIHKGLTDDTLTEDFHLGTKDIRPFFRLPEKIYGREEEVTRLTDGLERMGNGSSEVTFITGAPGSGKTALIQEMRRSYEMYNAYYVYVKIDQFKKGLSYFLVNEILRKLVGLILIESDQKRHMWKQLILDTIGENAWIIMNVVPELELIMGKMKKVQDIGYNESKNRFKNTVRQFYGLFPQPDHPLVIVVDDLQWADMASLSFIEAVMATTQTKYFSNILLYRDNEVTQDHKIYDLLSAAKKHGNDTYIHIRPLALVNIENMLGDITGQLPHSLEDISTLLQKKTGGNPFFLREVIKDYARKNWLSFDYKMNQWNFDLGKIQDDKVTDNVADFLVERLSVLTDTCKKVLIVASCLGNQFQIEDISQVSEISKDAIDNSIHLAYEEEIIQPLGGQRFKFAHDRLQKAAYGFADKSQHASIHHEIAMVYQKRYDNNPTYELLILLADHYNKAITLINDEHIISKMVELNCQISNHAKKSAAFESAFEHIRYAVKLYEEKCPNINQKMHHLIRLEYAVCASLVNQYSLSERLFQELLQDTYTVEDKVEIHIQRSILYGLLSDQDKAMKATMDGLLLLGVKIPYQPSKLDIVKEYISTKKVLRHVKVDRLIDHKVLKDKRIENIIRLMVNMVPVAYMGGYKKLFAWMAFKLVQLSVKHGHFYQSAYIYAMYGIILAVGFQQYDKSKDFGDLSIALNDKYHDLNTECRIYHGYGSFILPWTVHFDKTNQWLERGIQVALQAGDYMYMAHMMLSLHLWDQSLSFTKLLELKTKQLEIVKGANYKDLTDGLEILTGKYMNFLGRSKDPLSISYGSYDQDICLKEMKERNFVAGIAVYHMRRAEVLFARYAFEEAKVQANLSDKNKHGVMGLPYTVRISYMHYITEVMTTRRSSVINKEIRHVKKIAKQNPSNFMHLYLIMKAAYTLNHQDISNMVMQFDRAIQCARDNRWPVDEALANELIGKYLYDYNHRHAAAGYIVRAITLYSNCEAYGKVKHLRAYYMNLNELSTKLIETDEIEGMKTKPYESKKYENIDFESLLKSSYSVTSELNLEVLQQKILGIAVENAGAEKGILFVREDHQYKGTARVEKNRETILEMLPLESVEGVSQPLIQRIIQGEKYICYDDASHELELQSDIHVQSNKVKSLLVMGLYRNQDLRGILYLENNLLIGAFTPNRIELLHVLSSEMIVSLENARLYRELEEHNISLENEVAKRTKELEKMANTDPLTGLFNRRRMLGNLEHEYNRFMRNSRTFGIIIMDIDDFKSFNDTYGHDCGDYVLCEISKAISSVLRTQDSLARWGGEEFLVMLPETEKNGVKVVAEKIRQKVQEMRLYYNGEKLHITLTLGCSLYKDESYKVDDIINIADKALYEGKQNGKNCVRFLSV